jgi:plastocyanin
MNLLTMIKKSVVHGIIVALAFLSSGLQAHAAVDGISGSSPSPVFNLTAEAGYINVPEGSRIYMWGYGNGDGNMQYPGPTLIVNEGDVVTVNLTNRVVLPVSMVFAGQNDVTASGGTQGLLAREARYGETVTYTFTAAKPGTYMYYSGSRPELEIEMGLVGALIVRPVNAGIPILNQAYGHASSAFNQEFLFLLTEMDPTVHQKVEQGKINEIDSTDYFPVIWFINGRAAPDTMLDANSPLLPNQPYNCFPSTHPNDRVLMRIIGAGRDMHPFHAHGNHSKVIARDGRRMESAPGSGATTGEFTFTNTSVPGSTTDAIFSWNGNNIGWDIYGHAIDSALIPGLNEIFVGTTIAGGLGLGSPSVSVSVGTGFPASASFRAVIWPTAEAYPGTTREVVRLKRQAPGSATFDVVARGLEGTTETAWGGASDNIAYTDHGAPFPVILPSQEVLTFGQYYSGSPFLGGLGQLPPGEGGFNPNGGYFFMWHSHNEKEITSFDIFPGGMLTMMIIENPLVPLVNP